MNTFFLWALGLIISIVTAQDVSNSTEYFINPAAAGPVGNFAADEVWKVGQQQLIQWSTTLMNYSLILNLVAVNTSGEEINQANIAMLSAGTTSYNWIVSDLNLDAPLYYLGCGAFVNGPLVYFTSHYINITGAAPSSSSALTTKTILFTTHVSPTTTHNTASSTPSSSSTLSTDARIGLGVGLGVGVLILLIAAACLAARIMKKRQKSDPREIPHETSQPFRTHPGGTSPTQFRGSEGYGGQSPNSKYHFSEFSPGIGSVSELAGPDNRRW